MKIDRMVILIAALALEEAVVDCLLTLECEHGFNSFPVSAHHHRNMGLSLSEQVTGRQKQICFQIQIDEAGSKLLLERMKKEFTGAAIQYWIIPILANGEI